MATITPDVGRQVALDRIRVPDNVRALDDAHVQALAGPIVLQGMLVPVSSARTASASSWSPAFTASPPRGRLA